MNSARARPSSRWAAWTNSGCSANMQRVWIAGAALASANCTVRLASRRPAGPSGGFWVGGERVVELVARVDLELREHLVQVVLDRARADEQARADLGVREP